MKPAEANATWQKTWMRCGKSGSNGAFRAIGGSLVSLRTRRAPVGLIRVFKRNAAGTFAIAVFHAQRNGAQLESGLFGKLERRHGAFRLTFGVAAV
jgi:hypothetical protein